MRNKLLFFLFLISLAILSLLVVSLVFKIRGQNDKILLVNNNPKIKVSIASNPKIDIISKKFQQYFQNNPKLSVVITDINLMTGVQSVLTSNGKQVVYGGLASNSDLKNLVFSISIKTDIVKGVGWNQDNIAKYLEVSLYQLFFSLEVKNGNTDVPKEAVDYYMQLSKTIPQNLFKVEFVKI